MQFLASTLRSHVWRHKAVESEGQLVDWCTTGWSPPFDILCKTNARSWVEILSYHPLDTISCIDLQSHLWLRKALEPKPQAVDCCNTTCSLTIRYKMLPNSSNFTRKNILRAPTSSATIHNLPYGVWVRSFAKPDMVSQNRRKKLRRVAHNWIYRRNFLRRFCEAISGLAKL